MKRINTINQLEKFISQGIAYDFIGQGYLVVSRPGYHPQGGKTDLGRMLGMGSPILNKVLAIMETRGDVHLGRSVRKMLRD